MVLLCWLFPTACMHKENPPSSTETNHLELKAWRNPASAFQVYLWGSKMCWDALIKQTWLFETFDIKFQETFTM